MSKLIVEMEMPKCCDDCPLLDFNGDLCLITQETRGYNFNVYERRMDNCFIKGELPDEHGDLIDRDELLKECYPDDEFDAHVIYADDIHKAKAVIAAERKDDENHRCGCAD